MESVIQPRPLSAPIPRVADKPFSDPIKSTAHTTKQQKEATGSNQAIMQSLSPAPFTQEMSPVSDLMPSPMQSEKRDDTQMAPLSNSAEIDSSSSHSTIDITGNSESTSEQSNSTNSDLEPTIQKPFSLFNISSRQEATINPSGSPKKDTTSGKGGAIQHMDDGEQSERNEPADVITEDINYIFYFVGPNDVYGRAARAYMNSNYSNYRRHGVRSLQEIFLQMHEDLQLGSSDEQVEQQSELERQHRRLHIGHVILVSHAILSQPDKTELQDSNVINQGELFIAPTNRSLEHVSAESLAELQGEFRDGMHQSFRRQRSAVVTNAIDEYTVIEVRACRIAQADETMQALRGVFGGNANVRSTEAYQGYAQLPFGGSMTLERAVGVLIEQGSLPASFDEQSETEQREYIEQLMNRRGEIPTQHFISDGERDEFDAMTRQEQLDYLGQPLEDHNGPGTREQINGPAISGHTWRYALSPNRMNSNPFTSLSKAQIEQHARELNSPYRPENATELRLLRHAWEDVTLVDNMDLSDPLAGLPPEHIFGDTAVVDREAQRANRMRDSFIEDDIIFTEPTGRQRDVLSGLPDRVAVIEEVSIPNESENESGTETERRSRSIEERLARRRRERRQGSHSAEATQVAAAQETTDSRQALRLVRRDNEWYIFNRPAMRDEVVQYLFEDGFQPSDSELVGNEENLEIEPGLWVSVGSTHWMIPRYAFASRPDLLDHLRLGRIEDFSNLPQEQRQPQRPDWVPTSVWQEFMGEGEGTFSYNGGPYNTKIWLIRQGNHVSGYAEKVTNEAALSWLMNVAPRDFGRIFYQTDNERLARWIAEANTFYNTHMRNEIESGKTVSEATRSYRSAAHSRLAVTFIEALGGVATGGINSTADLIAWYIDQSLNL